MHPSHYGTAWSEQWEMMYESDYEEYLWWESLWGTDPHELEEIPWWVM